MSRIAGNMSASALLATAPTRVMRSPRSGTARAIATVCVVCVCVCVCCVCVCMHALSKSEVAFSI